MSTKADKWNESQAKKVSDRIKAVLAPLNAELKINIRFGTIRYSAKSLRTTIEVDFGTDKAPTTSPSETAFHKYHELFGLRLEDFRKTIEIRVGRKIIKAIITGILPKGEKNVIEVSAENGKIYRAPLDLVKNAILKADQAATAPIPKKVKRADAEIFGDLRGAELDLENVTEGRNGAQIVIETERLENLQKALIVELGRTPTTEEIWAI
jgi:hypothetical protein